MIVGRELEKVEPAVRWAEVLNVGPVAGDYFEVWLESPHIARTVRAGQFIEMRCSDNIHPLLPRPMSVEWVEPESGRIRVLVRRMGQGTTWLSRRRKGDEVFIYGPLGQPWPKLPQVAAETVLVGGGSGVAPLLCLAKEIAEAGRASQTVAQIGASSGVCILRANEFKNLGIETQTATEDGSEGFCGTVTELFVDHIQRNSVGAVYTCGPNAMMQKVAQRSQERGIPCAISLETFMACGYGVCLGCMVKNTDGRYLRACIDGPCFNSIELDWASVGDH